MAISRPCLIQEQDDHQGDVTRGAEIYRTCSSCHGADGRASGPRTRRSCSGSDDWYLVRQLENYKQGMRGSHPQDLYGKQMNLMTVMLRDDQEVKDVVAYINTL